MPPAAADGYSTAVLRLPAFSLGPLDMPNHPAAALPRRTANRPARGDLRWVAVATLLTFVASSAFELHERLGRLVAPFDAFQLDELPLCLAVLGLGLAWYGWRRWAEVALLLAHNRELSRQLIAVQERERTALARELHDELAQECTAIRLEAAYMTRTGDSELLGAAARRAAAASDRLLTALRAVLCKLRPAELDALGLEAALRSLAAAYTARNGVPCRVAVDGAVDDLGAAVDIAVYRVVQEALSNVTRHAGAAAVELGIARRIDVLTLRIDDDGRGFDAALQTRGLGLLGAGERAAALGGTLVATSAPGAGTGILMTLPLAPAVPGAAGSHA